MYEVTAGSVVMAAQLAADRYAVDITTKPGWSDVTVCGQLGEKAEVAFVP